MNKQSYRNQTFALATLFVVVAVFGWYCGWFSASSKRPILATGKDSERNDANGAIGLDAQFDIRSLAPDLNIPTLTLGNPEAGKRVKDVVPGFANTSVYHVIYLPADWEPGRQFPVIVEYAGNGGYKNEFGDISTGLVEGSKLGYGISGGQGFIWVCLPYLNGAGTENSVMWWGDPTSFDPQPTIEYCKQAVPLICEQYGGDPNRVLLAGFSRGAVACNFIGLHDDEISSLWCGFVPYSHYDGVSKFGLPGLDRDSAIGRLRRLGDRPQFICAENVPGKHSIDATREYLDSTGMKADFTFRSTGFRNHNDGWVLRPSQARKELREWVQRVVK